MDKNVAIGCKIALRYILLETELARLGRWDLWSEKMSSSFELQQVGRCYYLLPKGSFGSGKSRQKNQSNNWPWNWCICNVFYEKSGESCSDMAMAPHCSTLAWKNPWAEEPDRLQSMGSLRVRHDWVTSLSLFTFTHWRRKWQPTPVFLPGESQGRGSLVGCHLWGCTESDMTEAT